MPIVNSAKFSKAIAEGKSVDEAVAVSKTRGGTSKATAPIVVVETTEGKSILNPEILSRDTGVRARSIVTAGASRLDPKILARDTKVRARSIVVQSPVERPRVTAESQDSSLAKEPSQQESFSGKVEEREPSAEIGGGEVKRTQFFVKGREVGSIQQTPEGRRAVVRQPARLEFEERGTVGAILFGDEGAELINRSYSPSLELQSGEVSDFVSLPESDVSSIMGDEIKQISALSSAEKQKMMVEGIEARRDFPVFERLKLVYGSAGSQTFSIPGLDKEFSQPSIRGGIRASFEAVDIIAESIFKTLGIPQGQAVNIKIPENIVLSTIFLAPTSSTTAQIEKEILGVSRVNLAGVTQQIGKNKVITDAFFNVNRAGRNVKGVVSSKSVSVGEQGQVTNIITGSMGKTFSRGISAPSGKEVIRVGGQFKSGEFGQVTPSVSGNLFLSRGVGLTKSGGTKNLYTSVGVGQQSKNFLAQVGITEGRSGASVSSSLLKVKTGDLSTTFKSLGVSGGKGNLISSQMQSSNLLKSAGLQSTKSSVGASVTIPARQTLNILPTFSITKPIITTIKVPKSQVTIIPKTKIQRNVLGQKQSPAVRGGQVNISSSLSAQKSSQDQRQIPRPILKTGQSPLQRTLQRTFQLQRTSQGQRTLQRTKLLQRNVQRSRPLMTFYPLRTRGQGIIPFKLPKARQPSRTTGKVKLFIKEKGIWTPKGIFSDVSKASSMGQFLTGSQIHRSFKLSGQKAGIPSGFRRSRAKGQQNVFVELSRTSISQKGERQSLALGKLSKGIFGKQKKRKLKL